MGEQRGAFTSNSQFAAASGRDKFWHQNVHSVNPCQRVEVVERLSPTPEISFFPSEKIETDLPAQHSKPKAPDMNIAKITNIVDFFDVTKTLFLSNLDDVT